MSCTDCPHIHELTKVRYKAATSTKDGNIDYYYCDCGKIFSDPYAKVEITDVSVHYLVLNPAVLSTCTAEGNIAHYKCQGCGKLFSDVNGKNEINNIVVPKLPHDYNDQYSYDGDSHWQVCKNCPDVKTEAHSLTGAACSICGCYGNIMIDLSTFDKSNGSLKIKMANTEVTYELWDMVFKWATSNDRGSNTYSFGTAKLLNYTGSPTKKYKPLTNNCWRDVIVWCNAYSEMLGLTPVYYSDSTYTTPLRVSTLDNVDTSSIPGTQDCPYIKAATTGNTDVSNCTADGFRLPTKEEWVAAAQAGTGNLYAGTNDANELGDYAWYYSNSNDGGSLPYRQAHDVATKKPNEWDLYDMTGNLNEFVFSWSGDEIFMIGGYYSSSANISKLPSSSRDKPYAYDHKTVGFRTCQTIISN